MTPQEIEALRSEALKDKVDALSDMVDILKAQRDALAAQVEVQNDVIKYAHNKLYILSHNRNDVSARCIGDADKAFKVVDDYLSANKTPQQCLRDIQAEAGRAGWNACVDWLVENSSNLGWYSTYFTVGEFADKVRQGGAE